ncbi:hypothetical protein L7F22_041836 [Adiantum nelumboides]|nr:hypothetical protein [Adiantum nelumboides]
MPLIRALPPTFCAEVEATLPRPCGAQMVVETVLCGCGLVSIVQEGFVAETSFLVAMIAGSLVEVGARLTRKARNCRMVAAQMVSSDGGYGLPRDTAVAFVSRGWHPVKLMTDAFNCSTRTGATHDLLWNSMSENLSALEYMERDEDLSYEARVFIADTGICLLTLIT